MPTSSAYLSLAHSLSLSLFFSLSPSHFCLVLPTAASAQVLLVDSCDTSKKSVRPPPENAVLANKHQRKIEGEGEERERERERERKIHHNPSQEDEPYRAHMNCYSVVRSLRLYGDCAEERN
jgi:hypothetical protein